MHRPLLNILAVLWGILQAGLIQAQTQQPLGPIRVVATSTDLASLAREIGGERVVVFCLSQGPEDPLEGLRVAKTICDRFTLLRSGWKNEFEQRHDPFDKKLKTALAGEECSKDANLESVVVQFERAKSKTDLEALLKEHQLGRWLGAQHLTLLGLMLAHRFDLPPGQLIVAVLALVLVLAWCWKRICPHLSV